jgi:NitT/TauT family transport system permease protein
MPLAARIAERRAWPQIGPLLERHYATAVSILSVLAFLILWEVAADQHWINARLTGQPTLIYQAALDVFLKDRFLYHAWVSLAEFGIGFVLALIVGVPLGLIMGTHKGTRLFLEPPLMALYTAPRLALLPILIVWLGIGLASKIAVVFLGAVFPILVNTLAGVRNADNRLVQAARAFGATRMDIFVKILVPGSLPAILMGVRLGIGRGVLSVIVGEMFVAQAGIGYQIMSYGQGMQINKMLVYALTISLFSYALILAVQWLESRIRDWKPAA